MANVNLEVRVSAKTNIVAYKMMFDGQNVAINNDRGTITLAEGSAAYLQWWMLGDPGGSMKVEVLRDGTAIKTRNASTIPNTRPAGYDRFQISL